MYKKKKKSLPYRPPLRRLFPFFFFFSTLFQIYSTPKQGSSFRYYGDDATDCCLILATLAPVYMEFFQIIRKLYLHSISVLFASFIKMRNIEWAYSLCTYILNSRNRLAKRKKFLGKPTLWRGNFFETHRKRNIEKLRCTGTLFLRFCVFFRRGRVTDSAHTEKIRERRALWSQKIPRTF